MEQLIKTSNGNKFSKLMTKIFKGHKMDVITNIKTKVPWFYTNQLCKALGIKNSSQTLLKVKDSWKDGIPRKDSIGRMQTATIVNEAGMYQIIMRSDKPAAREFQEWIFEEVIPLTKETGSETDVLSQIKELREEIRQITNYKQTEAIIKRQNSLDKKLKEQDALFSNLFVLKTLLVRELSKVLTSINIPIKPLELHKFLRKKEWLLSDENHNQPAAFMIAEKYLIISKNGTTRVTETGQSFIAKALMKDLLKNRKRNNQPNMFEQLK